MFDATNIFLKSNMLAIKKSLHSNICLNEALSQFLNIAVIFWFIIAHISQNAR